MCYQMTAFKFGSKGMLIVLLTLVEVPMFLNQGMKTRSITLSDFYSYTQSYTFIHHLHIHKRKKKKKDTFTFYINIFQNVYPVN